MTALPLSGRQTSNTSPSPFRQCPCVSSVLLTFFIRFGYQRSSYSGTYSSGAISISFANLPIHKRYRTHNLKLFAVTPGPKEFNSEQLQYVMKDLVDDLIKLYEEGIVIETPLYPAGKFAHS